MCPDLEVSETLISNAKKFSDFRKKIKAILLKNNCEYDKFTITDRDSFDGYIGEQTFFEYLRDQLGLNQGETVCWVDENPLKDTLRERVLQCTPDERFTNKELAQLKKHFYDKWDVKVAGQRIDVKSTATVYTPADNWTYAIPKIQIEKGNKDLIVLNYVIYTKDPKKCTDAKPKKCVLIGALTVDSIKKYQITKENTYAHFAYQIENYETKISDYRSMDDYL